MPRFLRLCLVALLLALSVSAPAAENEPATAYLRYHAVLKSSYHERAIYPFLSQEARENLQRYNEEMRTRVFFIMKTGAPGSVTVTDARIEGDEAELTLLPESGGRSVIGTARMVREGGDWKVADVVWKSP